MDGFLTNAAKREEYRKEMISNYDYINWFENYIKLHNGINSDDVVLDDIDKDNVSKLGILFDVVDKYAYHNYIEFNSTEFGGFHNLKYNGVIYKIGYQGGQGVVYYASENKYARNGIDFNDIKNNKISNKTNQIKKEFEKLRKEVIKLRDLEVSYNYINNYINRMNDEERASRLGLRK